MTKRFSRSVAFLAVIGGLTTALLSASAPAAKAQVVVSSIYSLIGSTYHYDFQVQNKTGVDVSVVDVVIPATPGSTYITNAIAPPGYIINADEGSGSLVFAEDTSNFAANSTVDGFMLDSTMLIPNAGADGLTENGDPFTATTFSVQTPEAGTLPLLACAAGIATIAIYIRRRFVAAAN